MPKYLQKYKQEAEDLAKKRALLKERAKAPPGTRQIDEAERITTLEELTSTKK